MTTVDVHVGSPPPAVHVDTSGSGAPAVGVVPPAAAAKSFRASETFAVMGDLSAGEEIPGAFQSVAASQKSTLVEAIHMLQAGTATVRVRRNGVQVGADLEVSAAAHTTAIGVALADGDYLDLNVVDAADGASDLSLSLVIGVVV